MKGMEGVEDPRRRLLVRALGLGLFSAGVRTKEAGAQVLGAGPAKLPAGQSVYRLTGSATVNGVPADMRTLIRPGDTVETGVRSEIIFVVGEHSMIMRAESRLQIEGDQARPDSMLINALRLLTGKLLSVSRKSSMTVTTATATIGIRGTGWYAEADPEQTYFCTCYGSVRISATQDPDSTQTVNSNHHDHPVYILANAPRGESIRSAPFINHTDQELQLIETLAGRTLPFSYPKSYTPPPSPAY